MFGNLHSVSLERAHPNWVSLRNFYGAYILQDKAGRIIMQAKMYVTSTGVSTGCCLWLDLPDGVHVYTHGKVSGYGYNRESAAFVNALANAGADVEELRESGIQGGIGMSAIIARLQELLGNGLRYFYIGE